MELAKQLISNDKIVRSNTIQDLKDFNSQSVTMQAKKGEVLASMVPSIKEAFDSMDDLIVDLSTEIETLRK